ALREKSDPILDVASGPYADNAVKTEGLFDLNATDAGVGINAARNSSMQHVRKVNITNVDATSGEKATRLLRLNTAANKRRGSIRHGGVYSLARPQHRFQHSMLE
ncbi:MAG TPA: hypothetical protein VIE89_04780, partial [Candidatus Binatia bacterium]